MLHLLNFAFIKFVQIQEMKKENAKAFAYSMFGQCSQALRVGFLGWSCVWPGAGT